MNCCSHGQSWAGIGWIQKSGGHICGLAARCLRLDFNAGVTRFAVATRGVVMLVAGAAAGAMAGMIVAWVGCSVFLYSPGAGAGPGGKLEGTGGVYSG